jgi:hypothetical protein
MLTEKDYCDYDTCVALKELGFNSLVDWYFKEDKSIASSLARYRNTYIPRISLYEAQKWLREEKKVIVVILPYIYNMITETITWTYEIWLGDNLEGQVHDFKTYEEALSEGLREAVKILKEK